MGGFRNLIVFFALCALLVVCLGQAPQGGAHQSQGGPHQNQGRVRRQVSQVDQAGDDVQSDLNVSQNPQNWTTCDFTAVSKIACHDCNTRLICKPIGGLLKSCTNPYRPHCNMGICSAIPSSECA